MLDRLSRQRCAILARVSTEDQHLDAQTRQLEAEAERRGLEIVAVIEDTGSGRTMREREGLRRVLELADARSIDVLLVAELSRIGRSLSGVAHVLDRLTASGVTLVSLREQFDLGSAMGRAMAGMLAVFGQFEAEVLRERTCAGLAAAKARGARIGRAPFGTRWTDDGLVPVADEIETLRRARDLYAKLGRWQDVADSLTAEGRTTRSGTPWLRAKIARAVQNERVTALLDAA